MPHLQCIRAKTEPQSSPATWATVRKRYGWWLIVAAGLSLSACSQMSGLLHSDMAPAPSEAVSAPSQSSNADSKTPAAPAAAAAIAAPVAQSAAQPQPLPATTPTDTVVPAPTAATPSASAPHIATSPSTPIASAKTATNASSTTANDSAKPYFVHIGAFAVPSNAQNAYQKVQATGIMVTTQEVDTPKGRLTRVRAGPFLTRADADTAAKRIHELELDAVVLRDAPAAH